MSIRIRTALVIMVIIVVLTAGNFVSSLIFTRQSMEAAMDQELALAMNIADKLIATKINLLVSDASIVAERLLKADSPEEMEEIIDTEIADAKNDFLSISVLDSSGNALNLRAPCYSEALYSESAYFNSALSGMPNISSTHLDDHGKFIMHVFIPMGPDKVLSATISGLTFTYLVEDFQLWQTGNIFMIDSEGTVIADHERALVTDRFNTILDSGQNSDTQHGPFLLEDDQQQGVVFWEILLQRGEALLRL